MPSKLLGKFSILKLLALGTFISICCALSLAIRLFTKDIPSTRDSLAALLGQERGKPETGDEVESFHHPKNIFPALFKRQHQLKKEIREFNQTLNKLSQGNMNDIHQDDRENASNDLNKGIEKSVLTNKGVDGKGVKKALEGVDIKTKMEKEIVGDVIEGLSPCYDVHAFYYPWYGNPENDGKYIHWNHEYIQHWNKNQASKWRSGQHKPPYDIGSNYYPSLGAYSSSDPDVVDRHMAMMHYAKIGVVAVSWYPPGDGDRQEIEPDGLMPLILEKANKYKLKVVIHVEPYKNRNQHTMKDNIRYILKHYGSHPAFYRTDHGEKKNVPLLYIYDSYLVKANDWAQIFKSEGAQSVRGTELDGIFIGLLVEEKHKLDLVTGGFDGFYTYFATNGFTYGSTWRMWQDLSRFAKLNHMLFIPSVGPGYIDTEVRPWNARNTRKRLDGKYYSESFDNALKAGPKILSITSFNEWHEGTQIESAIKKEVTGRSYLDYGTNGEKYYLNLTRQWVGKFEKQLPQTQSE